MLTSVHRWFDAWAGTSPADDLLPQRVDWLRVMPFLAMHAGVAAVFWVGWSPVAVWTAVGLYLLRMFAITGFYHRYFSHRAFKTSRAGQFVFALLGSLCVERGPLWWAAHHREHHRRSDEPGDVHSPRQHGFLWSHVGWITSRANFRARLEHVPDLARFPELRFLDRYTMLVALSFGASMWGLGALLEAFAPHLGTTGAQMFVWGFVVSTVVLWHATFTINSLSHRYGRKRYPTSDDSRNNPWLALLTFGEGWHNNHHHYPASARMGFYWWEVDLTWYLLRLLAVFRIVWDLKPVPEAIRARRAPEAQGRPLAAQAPQGHP